MKKTQTFILYKDMNTFVQSMTDEQAGQLIKAVYKYALDGEVTPLDDAFVNSTFNFMKEKMDCSNDAYKAKCLKNKENAKKRWDANASKKDATACDRIKDDANTCLTKTKTKTDIKKESKTKVLPKKVGSRFNFEKHVDDVWYSEAKRLRPEFSDSNIQDQMDTFTDYWDGVAGAKGVKLDWLATWRNWIRRADAPKKKNKGGFNLNDWVNS